MHEEFEKNLEGVPRFQSWEDVRKELSMKEFELSQAIRSYNILNKEGTIFNQKGLDRLNTLSRFRFEVKEESGKYVAYATAIAKNEDEEETFIFKSDDLEHFDTEFFISIRAFLGDKPKDTH